MNTVQREAEQAASSNITKYYIAHILSGASFIVPITILYYLSYDLSYFKIAILESTFLLSALIFEIPTGALADTIGRRYVVTIGAFIVASATLLIGFGSSLPIFLIAQVLFGVGAALRSGADTSLMYDSMDAAGQSKNYTKLEGTSFALFSLFGAIAAPIGAYIFLSNHRMPFFIDGVILLFAAYTYFLMNEPKRQIDSASPKKKYRSILTSGIKTAVQNPMVRWYILFTVLLSAIIGFFASVLSQPLLLSKGISISMIGYVFSALLIIQMIGSLFAYRVETLFKEKTSLLLVFVIPGVSLFLMQFENIVYVLFFFACYYLSKGYQYPLLKKYIQTHIPASVRATVLSTQNFFDSIASIILLPILGFIVDHSSTSNGVKILGLLILSLGLVLFLMRPKEPQDGVELLANSI